MERGNPRQARIEVDTPTGRTWVVYGEEKLNHKGPLLDDLSREYELKGAGIVFNDAKQQFEYYVKE